MRLVFAGTPRDGAAVAARRCSTRRGTRSSPSSPGRTPSRAAGAGCIPARWPSSPRRRASRCSSPRKAGDPEFLDRLRELAPDCCPVVAYGALLPQAALDIPRHGWVNLHFSLLPAWRGAAPVQHAVLHGDEITGATTFQHRQGARRRARSTAWSPRQVRPDDTSGDLLARLAESGAGPARRHARRHRGRHAARPGRSPPRGEPRARRSSVDGRPGRLDRARACASTG